MQITVNGQHIAIVDDTLVSNSVNIYECEFEFDASWDGFAKTSVWQLNSDDPIEVVIDSGVAVIPHEVLENAGILRIGVYGTKDEKVMPTVWLEKRKVCLGTPTGSIGTEPTPSIYAQILAVATEAKDIAEEVQTEWESVSATAETLPSGSSATASFDDGVFSFGIPKGEQGERGEQGEKGEQGATPTITVTPITGGHRITISIESGGTGNIQIFDVMDGQDGQRGEDGVGITDIELTPNYCLEITLSNGTVITTTSIRGEKGEKGDKGDKGDRGEQGIQGETGNGIASITKTATVGKVDTYTITYTDGTTTTFDVTNGEVTEASLEEALYDKADVITNSASGTIASFSDGANMPVKSLEVDINAVQSGSGDPSPTNIRPISGWNAVELVRCGVNVWDEEWETGRYNITTGAKTTSATSLRCANRISVIPGAQYYVKAPISAYFVGFDASGDCIGILFNDSGQTAVKDKTITMPSNCHEIVYYCDNYQTYNNDISINYPSTNHEYHAYNGTTYPISLGSTVYGGVLDVTSGVLTVTHVKIPAPNENTDQWTAYSSCSGYYFNTNRLEVPMMVGSWFNDQNTMCNAYKKLSSYGASAGVGVRFGNNNANIYFANVNTEFPTVEDWLAHVQATGIEVSYPLVTPVEITLSDYPTITTLTGENNLWADCGDVAVLYRADTKAYIDGTIVDVPLAMIAPIENGTKSSKAYAVGEYFILNGTQFCKAKTSIASGATFTLNTNYTVTTIGAELKALA